MSDEVGERARGRHHQHERDVSPCPETARQRRAERQQPRQVETDMQQVGVQECVGEERPDIGGNTAR